MQPPFNWTCPYCDRDQSVTENNYSTGEIFFQARGTRGSLGLKASIIVCANPQCEKETISATIMNWGYWNGPRRFANNKPIKSSRLIPDSRARPQPEYIPKPVRDDYDEACRISDLSPKAAATLARRCLQGMIRDFCGISERSLALEVRKLRELAENDNAPRGVSFESIEAIDHVRKIGNIGAHMERDVNTIIDIDADEANQLIGLIEMLFHEWYTAHHLREERLDNLKKLAANKLRIREENTNQIDPAVDDDQVENKDL